MPLFYSYSEEWETLKNEKSAKVKMNVPNKTMFPDDNITVPTFNGEKTFSDEVTEPRFIGETMLSDDDITIPTFNGEKTFSDEVTEPRFIGEEERFCEKLQGLLEEEREKCKERRRCERLQCMLDERQKKVGMVWYGLTGLLVGMV